MKTAGRGVLFTGLILIALVCTSADAQGNGIGLKVQQEMVSGVYECSFFTEAPQYNHGLFIVFTGGTAGIIGQDSFEVGGDYLADLLPEGTDFFEFCNSTTRGMHERARSLGCTPGPIVTETGGYGGFESKRFRFVCHGARHKVVNAMSELSVELLTATE